MPTSYPADRATRQGRPSPCVPGARPPGAALRGVRAFTLIEVLLAITLGALLLTATAMTAGMFGTQLEALAEEQGSSLEEALTAIADDVRYAWWAEVPDSSTLTLSDPQGNCTSYLFRRDKLVVVRPGGVEGVLLEDLSAGSFSAETVMRFREGTPAVRSGTFWSAGLPTGTTPAATVLGPGDRLSIGFTVASPTPVGGSDVEGIVEQLLSAVPTTLSLPLAVIAPAGGLLTVTLYRARAPNDARPEGPSLGSFTLLPLTLPLASSVVINTQNGKVVKAPNGSVWGWWNTVSRRALVVEAPTVRVPLDLSLLGATLRPGHAYTLQLGISGVGGVALATGAIGSSDDSGIAIDDGGSGMLEAALKVACTLDGTLAISETLANTVVNRVAISFTDAGGTEVGGSVTLTGQGMTDDQWLGVVPGEVEP